jgi:amidohydrolase
MTLPVDHLSKGILTAARKLREDLHRHPELAYREERTAGVIARTLREAGLDEVRTGVAGTGVVALLHGGGPGRTVALRADIDALPIREETGLPYASVNDGVMHACGHDGHTAILLGAARVLAETRAHVPGAVKFIFQPAEEGEAGGRRMADAGVMRDPDVDAIFALHAASGLGAGKIQLAPVPYVAMCGFQIDVTGRGGHGAAPETTVDPILMGAQIVSAAQALVSRERRPDQPLVLSICTFEAGTKENIVPETARLQGTIRAMDMEALQKTRRALARLAGGIARSMRGRAEVTEHQVYPPVVNDARLLALVREVGVELLGRRNVIEAPVQRMASEDFAFYLSEQGGAPGVMFQLGIETDENHHTPRFDFGSAALEPGILMMVNVALRAAEGDAECGVRSAE